MNTRRTIRALVAAALLAANAYALPGPNESKMKPLGLTGTWVTTVTPPAEAGVPAFKLIFTFTEDGGLIATGTGGQFPALGNPCQGVWTNTPPRGYALTYLCLDYDASLQFTGTDKIRGNVSIDTVHNQLTGTLDLTSYDTTGAELFSSCCATVQGSRLLPESLPASSSASAAAGKPAWALARRRWLALAGAASE